MKVVVNEQVLELYREFCRLKGYKVSTTPIETLVDAATGVEEQHQREFAKWLSDDILKPFFENQLTNGEGK